MRQIISRDINKTIRFTCWSGILVLLLFLAQKNFILFGHETYKFNFSGFRDGISSFDLPGGPEKNLLTKERYQRLTTSPVSFTFRRPYSLKSIEIGMLIKPHPYPVIEIGVPWGGDDISSVDGVKFFKFYSPFADRILEDDAFEQFDDDGKYVFFQKTSFFSGRSDDIDVQDFTKDHVTKLINRDDFFATNLSGQRVGVYNIEDPTLFQIPGYVEDIKTFEFKTGFRGSNTIKTYLAKNRQLDFHFHFLDQNNLPGPDPIRIQIRNINNKVVKEMKIQDDGNSTDDQQINSLGWVDVVVNNLPVSFYYISIETTPDMIMEHLKTTNPLFAFLDRLVFSSPSQSATVFTNSTEMIFTANHKVGLQNIQVGNETVSLEKIETPESVSLKEGFYKIEIPKPDIILNMNGFISLYPNDQITLLSGFEIINDYSEYRSFDFIILKKNPEAVQQKDIFGNTWISRKFDIQDIEMSEKSRYLEISLRIPGLESGRDDVFVKEIQIKAERKSFLEMIPFFDGEK